MDRMKAFLHTPEGKEALKRLIVKNFYQNPRRWKRPQPTLRMIFIAVLGAILMAVPVLAIFIQPQTWQVRIITILLLLVLEYLLIPLFIGLSTVISSVPARIKTHCELQKAKQKLLKNKPLIIGVGGSYGKTSTKYLLFALLSQKTRVFKTPKSFNTPFSIARSINSHYDGEEIVILEYGTYKPGEIASLARWIAPNHVVITGFTEQHLHLFGSVENSLKAEAELIEAVGKEGQIWYNADDPRVGEILKFAVKSTEPNADSANPVKTPYSADQIVGVKIDSKGFLSVQVSQGAAIKTHLVGSHYLTNLAGAMTVARFFKLTDQEIERGLLSFEPDERFVRSYQGKQAWILDDGCTSNPEGFVEIIKIASNLDCPHKTLLTGGIVDLGGESEQIHHTLATKASQVFEQILYINDVDRQVFAEVLSDKMVSEMSKIISQLETLDSQSLLVIEGRMPGWLEPTLKKLGVKV